MDFPKSMKLKYSKTGDSQDMDFLKSMIVKTLT